MANFCLQAIYAQGHGTRVNGSAIHSLGLGLVVYWLCESQDSLKPYFRWITVPLETRPDVECVRFMVEFFEEFSDVTLSFKSKGKYYF